VGTSLHESLARLAELEDVSLNQYITNILARNVGAEENRLLKSRKVLSKK
jgi:predicted HicB family RNase H-like nuclease